MYSKENFHFEKKINNDLIIFNKDGLSHNVNLNKFDLFLFKNYNDTYTGIYCLDYIIDETDISIFSRTSGLLRGYDTKIQFNSKKSTLLEFISNHFFLGQKLNNMKNDLGQFSGYRLKHYTVLDFDNPVSESDELLYELGIGAPVGSISDGALLSPSDSYFNYILKNKLSCFKNYTGLSLIDSFTIVGSKNYDRNCYFRHSSWDSHYFRIFIFNQFLKSRLQIIANSFSKDQKKSRDYFEDCYSKYYLNKISFRFLPNEINKTIFKSLEIENDINYLKTRADSYSLKFNETQQKEQEFLLLCLSILTALEIPIHIEGIRDIIGITNYNIYNSIIYPSILVLLFTTFFIKFRNKKM
tara:strand:- start:1625 stop:2689 length:1065 start_codon:yes stop_codon:yes gene_type:complete